ncbi:MAG TPA: tyrosine-type recombinase/integrase, partial [Acidimicrobiales bacterium]|nr:tyrosine-type recombinase/integrase [Acidimicrobiales bacterium]
MTQARKRTSTFGNVRKLPSGRLQASYWHEGKRYTAAHTFATKADADAWLANERTSIGRGAWVDPEAGKVLFRDFAEVWLRARPDLRPRSTALYRSLLDTHLLPAFGSLPIARVIPSSVSTWHAALIAEKPGAAASAYRLLRAILASAVRDEKLVRSPCRVQKGGADRAVERQVQTVAAVQALTDAMPNGLRAAVVLAAWGALRPGEVLGLRRRDVDPMRSLVRVEQAQVELDDGTVIFGPPKTDAGVRTVHLPAHAMEEIEEHLARHVDSGRDALLFTGRGGVPMRPKTLASAFRSARAACELPHAHFHDLRHFGLTMAAATGASTAELMRRAGHRSAAAALRYQHATEDRDRAIANALSVMLERAKVVPISGVVRDPSRTNRARR